MTLRKPRRATVTVVLTLAEKDALETVVAYGLPAFGKYYTAEEALEKLRRARVAKPRRKP